MQNVQLHSNGAGKFVLLLTHTNNIVLKSCGEDFAFHCEIVKLFEQENNQKVTCLGGGFILITKYSIKCYGRSTEFGCADSVIVSHVLANAIHDKEIIIDLAKY